MECNAGVKVFSITHFMAPEFFTLLDADTFSCSTEDSLQIFEVIYLNA